MTAAAADPPSRVHPLSVEGVTLRRGGRTALDDVRFAVAPGSVHALIGPTGAGKSSCLDVISGLVRPTMGAVRFGEWLITSMPAGQLVGLGIGRSFQHPTLSPGSTVLDNVLVGRYALTDGGFLAGALRLGRRTRRRHAGRAAQICDVLGLADRLHDPVEELPFRLAKRVDIARALAVEPALLLLDEPAAGLPAADEAELTTLVGDVAKELGISVLLALPEPGSVLDIADRVTVLDAGRVTAEGPAPVTADAGADL